MLARRVAPLSSPLASLRRRILAVAALAALSLACAQPGAPQHTYKLRDGADASGVRGFFVTPTNAFDPLDPELAPGVERVSVELRRYLVHHGKAHEDPSSLFEYREAFARASAGAAEAKGGERPTESEVYRALYEELGGGIDFDAILVPDVLIRSAKLEGRKAHWDGVRRAQKSPAGMTWSGGTTAASLRVRVFDSEGERLFMGVGGLDMLFQPNIAEKRMEVVDNPLSNRRNLREGIAIAMDPYLPMARDFVRK